MPVNKVLIIGKVWPEPDSSAAGTRMMQLIDLFSENNCEVHFASAAQESDFSDSLEDIGIQKHLIFLNDESFDVFVKTLQPQMVVFDRFTTEEQFGWRVAAQCPDALRILDTEDLHCLRAARETALLEKREFELNDLQSTIARREIAAIFRCDLSIIISQYEMQLLQDYFKVDKSLLLYLPLFANKITQETKSQWPTFSERKHFVSIGNFLHAPNWDAVQYLKFGIWPLIKKQIPDAEIHVYGAYATDKVFALNDVKSGFLVKGRAENVDEVMAGARVCLAPLRFGAGLKGKLMDAMVNGTPNVTTDVGAEGMTGGLEWSGRIENTAEAFAKAAVELYTNEKEWGNAQKNGIKIINSIFLREKYEPDLVNRLNSTITNLEQHRKSNFIGAMLMQHTTQSTKYMALWIEAKNKI